LESDPIRLIDHIGIINLKACQEKIEGLKEDDPTSILAPETGKKINAISKKILE
jgi:hypothetical protein